MKRLARFGVALLAAVIGACTLGSDRVTCTNQAIYGLRVTVIHGWSSPAGDQCGTTVSAAGGGYNEILTCSIQGLNCECYGLAERAGTYNVVATRNDGASASQTVTVHSGACHVETEEITLQPQ